MKRVIKIILLAVVIAFTSCDKSKRAPNLQYMPNMYEPVSYETYGNNPNYAAGMEERMPVVGTVARGSELPFDYENTEEGYQLAKTALKSTLTEIDAERSKSLYTIYCASCHGSKGDGQGELSKREKFLGIPDYKDRDITEGSIYHVIMYGKSMMGSHASQLTEEERWQVVAYVQELKNN